MKVKISRYISELRNPLTGAGVYVEMPVPTGYGKSGLDYTLCFYGHFISIEAKAPGEWLTPRQRVTVLEMLNAGATVFLISSDEGLNAFKRWVERCRRSFADTAGK